MYCAVVIRQDDKGPQASTLEDGDSRSSGPRFSHLGSRTQGFGLGACNVLF